MAKGGRGGSQNGGNSGMSVSTSAVAQDGTTIDLSDTPLRYGGNDKALSAKERAALETQEKKRLSAKVEYAYAVDAEGNPVGNEKRGGKGSVSVPYSMYVEGGTLTHNHPRVGEEAGMLGGTFSTADLNGFALRGIRTMRASASEGTYSITKGTNFNAQGLTSYRRELERSANKAAKEKVNSAGEKFKRGEISRIQLMAEAKKAGNEALVSIHNGLIAGQKEYGYSYTLERRS